MSRKEKKRITDRQEKEQKCREAVTDRGDLQTITVRMKDQRRERQSEGNKGMR